MKLGRYAAGFLAWLDSKGVGVSPSQASDFVQPVVDMQSFYDLNYIEIVHQLVTTTPTTATFFGLPIPQDEAWRIHSFGWHSIAGVSIKDGAFVMGITPGNLTAFDEFATIKEPYKCTDEMGGDGIFFETPFVLKGGQLQLRCVLAPPAGLPVQFQLSALITRIEL